MQGYAVVTSDERPFGRVVEARGDYLVVEHGSLRKRRHAVPKAFAHAVGGERIVRTTVSKRLIEESPRIVEGAVDEQALARHYGLSERAAT